MTWSSRSFAARMAIIAGSAALLRIAYVLLTKLGTDACGEAVCGDAIYYSAQADVIADGRWFSDPFSPGLPAADHPPLTALVGAPASFFFDNSDLAQRLTMAMVGVAAVIVIGLLGRRIAGERVGLLAAGIAALYPNLWVNDGLMMAESVTALLVAGVLLALYRYHDGPGTAMAAGVGALCGLAVLARAEQGLLLPLAVLPTVLLTRRISLGERVLAVLVAGAAAAVVLLPWVAYNLTRFEEPVLLSTNDGLTLLGANCDQVYSGPATGFWDYGCGTAVTAEGDQSVVSEARRDAAFEYFSNHQSRLPSVIALRVARTWSIYAPDQMVWFNVGEGRERAVSWAGFWAYLVLLPLAVAGAVILRRRQRLVWPLLSTAFVVTLTSALFYGIARFRIPAEVAIAVLAAVAIDASGFPERAHDLFARARYRAHANGQPQVARR